MKEKSIICERILNHIKRGKNIIIKLNIIYT